MLKTIISILGILFFFYLVFLGYVYFFQHRLVYVPFSDLDSDPSRIGLSYREVFLDVPGGKIHAWFIPAEEERGVVLFCHGNAGNISHRLQSIEMLHFLGMSIMIFDYQGYGKSSGKPSEKNTYQDAETAWNYLVDHRGIAQEKIFIFGRSLGGAVAADLASRTRPAGVILESTFTSARDIASDLFFFLPVRLLSRFDYDTLKKLNQISSPLKIIHSPDDEIIPFAHGQRLYQAAPEPKYFTEIHGGHNTGYLDSREQYLEELDAFFSRYLP
jgi:uncharacterized protein